MIFLVVYIREAHPAEANQTAEDAGWKTFKLKDGETYLFHQPKTYEDRRKLAEGACTFWELPIPALVDTVEPSIGLTYQSWPNRIYFIGKDGKIIYHGVKGPSGANARPAEDALRKHFGVKEDEKFVTPASRPGGSSSGRTRTPR